MSDLVVHQARGDMIAGAESDDHRCTEARNHVPLRRCRIIRADGLAAQVAEVVKVAYGALAHPDRVEVLRQPGGDVGRQFGALLIRPDGIVARADDHDPGQEAFPHAATRWFGASSTR
ncbi:hypothetical protein ABZW11_30315 [Nonomuraea sp. NPDC004580]|uniref:aromatic-ring hydroxylase C-terminal domain-containing protein n=1 Tax=Nonomuraea sp. NPDC004580 TaxID=3154552 RepID=UPI0033A6744D